MPKRPDRLRLPRPRGAAAVPAAALAWVLTLPLALILAAALPTGLLLASAPVSAADGATGRAPTLESLLAQIGGKAEQQVRYTEKQYLAILDEPLRSSGVLRYRAPDRLEKATETPRRETLSIEGDALVLERDGRRRSMPSSQLPGVSALVGALRDTLAGNAAALRKLFKVVVQGSDARWQIDLLPNDAAAATLVVRITLRGADAMLTEIELLHADGDRSVMQLSPL